MELTLVADSEIVNLAEVVQRLTPIDPTYMNLPIQDGFNWAECFCDLPSGTWYLVVFRSRHQPSANKHLLHEYDELAYEAARRSPGFVHYFGGTPSEQGNCLSFCLWENQSTAQTASRHTAHQEAQKLAFEMYEFYQLERHLISVTDGTLSFESVFPQGHSIGSHDVQ
jgi:hypothetical protein